MAFNNNEKGSMFNLTSIKPHKVSTEIQGNILIYGMPKCGKTSFCHAMWGEKMLLLATERGYNYLDGVFALDITKYSDFAKIIRELKKPEVKEKFKVVVIDTVDIAEKLTVSYITKLANVDALGDVPYGKLYKQLDELIEGIILGIAREGYQICFISHASSKSSMDANDDTIYTTPTMSRRVNNVISKFCDHILYFSIEQDEEGTLKRYINCRGTDTYMAGSRIKTLKPKIELDAEIFKKEVEEAILRIGGTDTQEETSNIPTPIFKERTFEEIKASVISIVKNKFLDTDNIDVAKDIIDNTLGHDKLVSETTVSDKDALEVLEIELENKVEELGL